MKGLVYITGNDPTECAWMIAVKFAQVTDMSIKELASKIIELNEDVRRVSMGFFRKPEDTWHDYINPYQLVFVKQKFKNKHQRYQRNSWIKINSKKGINYG